MGLAKSGTHSIANMLMNACRSAHEPEPEPLLSLLAAGRSQPHDVGQFRQFFIDRDRRLQLDFEANHLLGNFTPHLVDAFPEARFILLVRDCFNWMNSMIDDQLNLRTWEGYPKWQVVYDHYLDSTDKAFPAEEEALQSLDLYPVSHYIRSWANQVQTIRAAVPAVQLLTLRTDALSKSAAALGEFINVPSSRINVSMSHSYKSPKRHNLLATMSRDYVRRLIDLEIQRDNSGILSRFDRPQNGTTARQRTL